ncbi:hypothetical protein LINGRAHAP2_LOCUS26219 [Linum grandiflorum]
MANSNKKRKHFGLEDEEETRLLLLQSPGCKVVEYLQPVMSKELLVKFPDNSAFDFNYSESSIWSPLVPRIHNFGGGFLPKLDLGEEEDRSGRLRKKRRKKMTMAAEAEETEEDGDGVSCRFDFGRGSKGKEEKENRVEGCTSTASCVPFASKGWNKVMKAATKHFKKKKMIKRRGSHVMLCNYLAKLP